MYKLTCIGDRNSTFDAVGILVVFTLLFSAAMSLLTKAKRHELFAASAAYCAVLVVFISNFNYVNEKAPHWWHGSAAHVKGSAPTLARVLKMTLILDTCSPMFCLDLSALLLCISLHRNTFLFHVINHHEIYENTYRKTFPHITRLRTTWTTLYIYIIYVYVLFRTSRFPLHE